MATTAPLPPYPSHSSIKSLSPSQKSTLTQSISISLLQTLALPPPKRDPPATRIFVSSYAHEEARAILADLIWDNQAGKPGHYGKAAAKTDIVIRNRVLLLAEKLAASSPGLDVQTLVDLSIVYAQSHPSRLKSLLATAFDTTPHILSSEIVTAFTYLLSPLHSSQGLYALRKTAHCLLSLFRSSPPVLTHLFSSNKPFILALAKAYDEGLAAIARSYGGVRGHFFEDTWIGEGEVDEWERIWVETKVELMDSFHLVLGGMLRHLSGANGNALGMEAERTFDIIFAMLELPSSTSSNSSGLSEPTTVTPFLNRPLLADYQHSYNLSQTLSSALRRAAAEEEKDARLELLESTLRSFEVLSSNDGGKDPGALKILLRSSGVPPGIDNLGHGRGKQHTKPQSQHRSHTASTTTITDIKGKGKASPNDNIQDQDSDLDLKTTQVLSILPDHDPSYICALLARPGASVESVVEMLLEETAPAVEELERVGASAGAGQEVRAGVEEEFEYTKDRRNVFDDEIIDMSSVRIGKKSQDESTILRDRTFIEQMKADILRRVEAISDSEDEDDDKLSPSTNRGTTKGRTVAFEEELDDDGASVAGTVKVLGDGEESSAATDNDEEGGDDEHEPGAEEQRGKQNPETILELAYIRDPALFDRDAQTRRGKRRVELKEATGWSDEQIEGWRIMLERNPKKDKILQKHEFAGNQPLNLAEGPSSSATLRGGGRGRGRGGRGGGGRGRGGGGEQGGGTAGSARERAWKDKNKASRGNHNRKRGHDKKMARAGGPMPSA